MTTLDPRQGSLQRPFSRLMHNPPMNHRLLCLLCCVLLASLACAPLAAQDSAGEAD